MKKLKKKIELIKNKHLCLLFVALFFSFHSFAQSIFYQDVFYGGVTGGGFSSGSNNSSVVGQIIVNIDPSSSIKKAFLFCNRYENTQPLNVLFNSSTVTFNTNNQIGSNYFIIASGSIDSSAIHMIDVTNEISPSQNTYNINYPSQPNTGGAFNQYGAFYLLILYENPLLNKTAVSIIINEKDATPNVNYQINNLLPINTSNPVGLAIHSDIIWDTIQDGSNIYVNGNYLGIIGGSDAINSTWIGGGVKGHFYYQNNTLFGLDDDTPDSLMAGTDGLADIKNYLSNGDSSININLIKQPTAPYNVYLAFFLAYTTPCDTFTTTATTNIDMVCQGENIQLNASGGVTYNWFSAFSAFSTFNDSTLANPIATPTQTTTYVVTIKNDSGCVKTEHVKIWVHPTPKPDTITTTPQRCGSANGSITVGNIPQSTPPFNYQLTNLQTLNTINQTLTTFNNLTAANYLLQISDTNGCQWQSDTLFVPEINDITVNFSVYTLPWVFPQPNPLGTAPLTVYTQNASVNTNLYEWWVVSGGLGVRDTIEQIPASAGMTSPNFDFDSGGTFEICLLAYNNIPTCGDTVCKTVVIAPNSGVDSLVLIVPNVFSPNHNGNNDNFVLQVQGADLLGNIEVEIFNRWGQTVQSSEFDVQGSQHSTPTTYYTLWDGTTNAGKEVPEGTYFYVVNYTKLSGETESLKGTVMLLR